MTKDTVSLRVIELRTDSVALPGIEKPVELPYAGYLRQVILTPPERGNSCDDVLRQMEVWTPIKKAIDSGAARVLLAQSDYDYLKQKMDAFKWSGSPEFQESIAGFITHVRSAHPQPFEATPHEG